MIPAAAGLGASRLPHTSTHDLRSSLLSPEADIENLSTSREGADAVPMSHFELSHDEVAELGTTQPTTMRDAVHALATRAYNALPSRDTLRSYVPTKKQATAGGLMLLVGGAGFGHLSNEVSVLRTRVAGITNPSFYEGHTVAEKCALKLGNDAWQSNKLENARANFFDAGGCGDVAEQYAKNAAFAFADATKERREAVELGCSPSERYSNILGATNLREGEARFAKFAANHSDEKFFGYSGNSTASYEAIHAEFKKTAKSQKPIELAYHEAISRHIGSDATAAGRSEIDEIIASDKNDLAHYGFPTEAATCDELEAMRDMPQNIIG